MMIMFSRLSTLCILYLPRSVSSKVDPVEKNRLAASSVCDEIYRVQTTEIPSVTQKFSKEGSEACTAVVYELMRAMVSNMVLYRIECGIDRDLGSMYCQPNWFPTTSAQNLAGKCDRVLTVDKIWR